MTSPKLAWAALAAYCILPAAVAAKDPPIKVRVDKEPYEPYKQLLPTDKVIEQ